MKKIACFFTFLLFLISLGLQQSYAETPRSQGTDNQVKLTTQDGVKNIYVYDANRLLVRRRYRKVTIKYIYDSKKLLAYATTNKGTTYTIARDRSQRITMIYGSAGTLQTEFDTGGILSAVTVTNAKGRVFKPKVAPLKISGNGGGESDQQIARIYEQLNSLDEVCDDWDCGETDPGGGGGEPTEPDPDPGSCDESANRLAQVQQPNSLVGNKLSLVVLTTNGQSCPIPIPAQDQRCLEGCQSLYDNVDIPQCWRIYPTDSQEDRQGRAICYARANNRQGECRKNC